MNKLDYIDWLDKFEYDLDKVFQECTEFGSFPEFAKAEYKKVFGG